MWGWDLDRLRPGSSGESPEGKSLDENRSFIPGTPRRAGKHGKEAEREAGGPREGLEGPRISLTGFCPTPKTLPAPCKEEGRSGDFPPLCPKVRSAEA